MSTGEPATREEVELARVEAGQLEVQDAPTDVRDLAQKMMGEYRAQVEAAGLTLVSEIPERFPVVQSDPRRVRQIPGNLISNAIKYNREGGQVVLKVGLRRRDATPAGRWIAVDVADTGTGIPPEKRHLIFQEFTRLEPHAKHGAGLGLAISRRIAHALGGGDHVPQLGRRGDHLHALDPGRKGGGRRRARVTLRTR